MRCYHCELPCKDYINVEFRVKFPFLHYESRKIGYCPEHNAQVRSKVGHVGYIVNDLNSVTYNYTRSN